MLLFILHIVVALLVVGGCWVILKFRKTDSFWVCFLLGWCLQVLLSLPAGIIQACLSVFHGTSWWVRVLMPLVGWPFNSGGLTIRGLFEVTVVPLEWLVGNRTTTVMSNMPYYWFLLVLQSSVIAIIFALWYKKRKRLLHWLPICMVVLFLINSIANMGWPWWGS